MNKLSKLLIAVILGVGVMAVNAMATPIAFDMSGPSSQVLLSDIQKLGSSTMTAALAPGLDNEIFTLQDGQTKQFDFFTLTTIGLGLGEYDITAKLAFDAPFAKPVIGSGDGAWLATNIFGAKIRAGYLCWDTGVPSTFTIGTGDSITVAFEDKLYLGSSTTVHAFVTNNGGGSAPVPEPGTIVLLGTGLVGLGLYGRRKIKK